jgi:hypothetical protein
LSPELYTAYFDSVVLSIRAMIDPEHKIQFTGLALSHAWLWEYYEYFLDATKHAPGVEVPAEISFHFYAIAPVCHNVSTYDDIFPQTEVFLSHIANIFGIE